MARAYLSLELRRQVEERARGQCEYCRALAAYSPAAFALEHIVPLAGGGESELDNLAFACDDCNEHKATRTTARDTRTGEMAPLFHPRCQIWREHFVWSEDLSQVVGLTPTGRATVVALHLNRQRIVNLRGVLRRVSLHPPPDSQNR